MSELPDRELPYVGRQTPCEGETGGKGAGHNLEKIDAAQGHDINWLEPNRSKMANKSTSARI